MASTDPPGGDTSRPALGAPGGLDAIMRKAFGVTSRPTLDRDEVVRRVKAALSARAITYEALYVSDVPVHRGALFDAAGRRVPFPDGATYDRCVVMLVDPDERARWGHPAFWAFVPANGEGDVALQDTTLPEHSRGSVRLEPIT